MIPVAFHPEARLEFIESVLYYELQQPGLGQRFSDAVADAVRRIQIHPEAYRKIHPGMRQCRVPRFPYGLVYKVHDQELQVLAVMHLYRRPGYWRERK